VFRQTFIEEGEVGIDDRARRQVAVEQFLHEEPRFLDAASFSGSSSS
jgi:hypothetical protein